MSKGETLRRFVSRRLAAASREILAAVEEAVAGYEQEAAGFRSQIDRQRRKLEELLGSTGVKRSRSLGLAEEEEEDEDEASPEHPENLEDPTDQTPTRSLPPGGLCKKRRSGRPDTSKAPSHVDLRIRILEDSGTDVLTNSVLKKCRLLKLKCPRGLREPDFLDLLRSTFPQLSGVERHFDLLTSDSSRRLEPLELTTVTPEEICRNVSCSGGTKSTLYLRLKER